MAGALVALLVVLIGSPALAQTEGPEFSVGGLAFGDLYGVASHHDSAGQGAAGAVARRGYLTGDVTFNESWAARVRLEANQSGEFETYDYSVDFKDVYLRWRLRRQRITFGLSPTPVFDLVEEVWGLRYLMRTPMDLQGVASRDTGIAAAGPIDGNGSLAYRAMIGAGLEFGHESGDGRKWMGALTWRPAAAWVVDVYADYEFLSGDIDRATLQGFVGYRTDAWRWGLLYSSQDRQSDPALELASAFVAARVGGETEVVMRVDRLLQPSPKGDDISYIPFDPTARATLLLGAAEFRVRPTLRMTPNVVLIAYDRNSEGHRPRGDAYLRLTLFLDLE